METAAIHSYADKLKMAAAPGVEVIDSGGARIFLMEVGRCSCSFEVEEKIKLMSRSGLIKSNIDKSINDASVPQTFLQRVK